MQRINTDIIIDGSSLFTTCGALVTSADDSPPDPKTYTVDIPGGNGVIDLTDAMAGGPVYDTRSQEFGLMFAEDAESGYNRLVRMVHGKRAAYELSDDPGYTYRGRFAMGDVERKGKGSQLIITAKLSITADPYKTRGTQAYKLNATGGKLYRFESGRRKVHPTIECEQPCFVTWNGEETIVPAGTYRLNDVVFSQGFNELWVNTKRFFDITWGEIAEGGQFASTWDDLDGMRWDEIHMLGQSTEDVVRSWDDLALTRWEDLSEKHWYDLNYIKNVVGDSTAYLTYEWEDL